MNKPLFRQEALLAQREKLIGEALVARPLVASALPLAALAIALLMLSYLFFGHYTRKEHVSGFVTPSTGLIKIFAPEPGTVLKKLVRGGQTVHAGDPLFVLSFERSAPGQPGVETSAIASLEARRASLELEIGRQQQLDLIARRDNEARVASEERELAELDSSLGLQRQRVDGAERAVQRLRDLPANFVSKAQVQQLENDALDQQARLRELERSRVVLSRDLGSLRAARGALEQKGSNERAEIERRVQELNQQLAERGARRELMVRAPEAGVVSSVLVENGQTVSPSAPLLAILPEGATLKAELLVPTRAAGFIRTAQKVSLRYQPFPYQRFGSYGGEVEEIDTSIVTANDVVLPIPLTEPVYRVTVKLDQQNVAVYGERRALQAGMLLDADIEVDRRRLIEWLLDPLYSVAGRL